MHKLISLLILLTLISPTIVSSDSYNEELCRIKDELLQPQNWNYTKEEEAKGDSIYKALLSDMEKYPDVMIFHERILWAGTRRDNPPRVLPSYWERALLKIVLDTSMHEEFRIGSLRNLLDFKVDKYSDLILHMSNDSSDDVRRIVAIFAYRLDNKELLFHMAKDSSSKVKGIVASYAFKAGNIKLSKELISDLNEKGKPFFIGGLNKNPEMKMFLENLIESNSNPLNRLYFLEVHAREFCEKEYVFRHLMKIELVLQSLQQLQMKFPKIKKDIQDIKDLVDPIKIQEMKEYIAFLQQKMPIADLENGMKAIHKERKKSLRVTREEYLKNSKKHSQKFQFPMGKKKPLLPEIPDVH